MRSPYKYAQLERERRFLLREAPPFRAGSQIRRIEDLYLDGTRLRLRVVREDGSAPIYKLGQKIRPNQRQPSTVAHTTLYLDQSEYDALRVLPGEVLTKTRTLVPWVAEVTDDERFTGGALARTSAEALRRVLDEQHKDGSPR